MTQAKKLMLAIGAAVAMFAAVVSFNYYQSYRICDGIVAYDPVRDRAFILSLFSQHWHWLVSEYSTDFSAEYMLDHHISSRALGHDGDLTILTYQREGKPIGFVAYYLKSFYKGFILFLGVDETYRRAGYAHKLLTFAVQDLFSQGCSIVQLITRVSNEKAQGLYKKVGFNEIWRDEGFVKFEIKHP